MSDQRPRRFGAYEVLTLIGRGNATDVFRARTVDGEHAGQWVALKRLRPEVARVPEASAIFDHAMRMASRQRHANMVRVQEANVLTGVHFAALELVDGLDLAKLVKRLSQRKLTVPVEFTLFIQQIYLRALDHLHAAGLIHGAPTPANVFVSTAGEVKLADLGMAQVRQAAEGARAIAVESSYPIANPLREGFTRAMDVWWAAATLYELITLRRPYEGRTSLRVAAAMRSGHRPMSQFRSDVPPEVEAVVERGLDPHPEERFETAAQFAVEVGRLFDPMVGNPMAIAALVRSVAVKEPGATFGARPPRTPAPVRAPAPAPSRAPPSEWNFPPAPQRAPATAPQAVKNWGLELPAPEDDDATLLLTLPGKLPEPRDEPTQGNLLQRTPGPKGGLELPDDEPDKDATLFRPAKRSKPDELDPKEAVRRIMGAEGKFQRGMRLLKRKKFNAAHQAFSEAMRLQSDEPEIHAYLAWCMFRAHPKEPHAAASALRSLDQAIKLGPKLDKGFLFSGYILKALGNKEEAAKRFEVVLKLKPGDSEATRELRALKKK